MREVYETAFRALREADADPAVSWLMFVHGSSTLRSKEATPYIIRKTSIQHRNVFVAALRKQEYNH